MGTTSVLERDRAWVLALTACMALCIAACGGDVPAVPDSATIDAAVADAAPDASGDNATLAALAISTGVLDPPFEPDLLEYELHLGLATDSVVVTATAALVGAIVSVDGTTLPSGTASDPVALPLGSRDIAIVVQSGARSTTYAIHVRRGSEALAAVQVSYAGGALPNPLAPTFDPATSAYSIDVGLWVEKLQVTLTPVDPAATLTVSGGAVSAGAPSLPVPLNLGLTQIPVVVTAPDATQRTYTLSVTRASQVLHRTYAKASNTGPADRFGHSVALWGDTLAVGASFEDSPATGIGGNQTDNSASGAGAVYVFTRTGGVWSQQAYLKASNTGADDGFGASIALWGDTLAVGATGEASAATGVGGNQADNTAALAGAVYVFTRTGTTWSQQSYLKASNSGAGDQLGHALALWGDTLAVGAPYEDSVATGVGGNQADNSATTAGAVYVFTRTGGVWSQQAYVKASNTGAGDHFGFAVAVSGDSLAVGAYQEDGATTGVGGSETDNTAATAGAVYVYGRAGSIWTQQAYVKASNASAGDGFGLSVALWGDTLVAGAPLEASNATGVGGNQADNSALVAGAAYVFTRTGTTWTQQAYLKASNTGTDDSFGYTLALWGDILAVAAPYEDSASTGVGGSEVDNTASSAGAVYMFTRAGTVWSHRSYLKASNTGAADELGLALALWGDTVVAGAAREDSNATGVGGNQADNTASESGAVHLFR